MGSESPESSVVQAEAPLGMYSARMDDKGRIKLPVDFQTFFTSFNDKRFFITSMDGVTSQIYPISVWRENLKFLAASQEDPDAVSDLLFNANDLGAVAEMDSAGRITVCPQLREELNLMGQELRLQVVGSRVEVINNAVYEERRRAARPAADENGKRKATQNMRMLLQKGLQ